jgi:hypothetical protein
MYQMASERGAVADFLKYAKKADPAVAAALERAGGDKAARTGTAEFKKTWRDLATQDPVKFAQLQHAYVKDKMYGVAASGMKSKFGVDPAARSNALREVIWSTAVQHGASGSQKVVGNALAGRPAGSLGDRELIQAIYAERAKHFTKSTPKEREAVLNRFKQEEQDALKMLEGEKR